VVIRADETDGRVGIRSRLGEWSYSLGMLWPMQRLCAPQRRNLRILAYHRVLDVPDPARFEFDLEVVSTSPSLFRDQMRLLKQRFNPVSLGDVVTTLREGRTLPPNSVAVTFDDGYNDNYHTAFPILREVGVPATFFVSTGHVGSGLPFAYDWLVHMVLTTDACVIDVPEVGISETLPTTRPGRRALAQALLDRLKSLGDAEQTTLIARLEQEWRMPRSTVSECKPVNWEQLREMRDAGFEIGSHGVSHRMLSKLSQPELQDELTESKAALEKELGVEANLMAYPVGSERAFDERVIAATAAAGYLLACAYIRGVNRNPLENRYALRRLPVEREMGLGWFASMLTFPGLMSYPTVAATLASRRT
jgi:peptidoglycan/xylan/chitin deacetylase (PgdA/CDA1 family)